MIRSLSSAIGMNSPGGIKPRCGWRQRTSASKPMIRRVAVPLRLIFEEQLAVARGLLQVALQRAPLAQLLVHGGGEEAGGAAAFVFCPVERGIGVGEQRLRVVAVARDRSQCRSTRSRSNACPSISMSPSSAPRRRLGEQLGARRQRQLLGDGDELVAADAREERALGRKLEALRNQAKRRVAHRMAEQVVDLLEAVEVDAQDGEAAVARSAHRPAPWDRWPFSAARFGRSVSASCQARCSAVSFASVSACSARYCSVMSSCVATQPWSGIGRWQIRNTRPLASSTIGIVGLVGGGDAVAPDEIFLLGHRREASGRKAEIDDLAQRACRASRSRGGRSYMST